MCVLQFLIPILIGSLTIKGSKGESSISVGVIDLRPKLSSDRIYLIDNSCVGKAIFPKIEQGEDDLDPIYDDNMFDQQSAAAHCIGSECSTVYLMIAYDFEHEKTVLHRAVGGIKLMSFVDGSRKAWETRRTKTKLILLLVPSSASSKNQLQSVLSYITNNPDDTKTEMHDLTNNIKDSAMLKGAKVLLERLHSCFEYGGEQFQNLEIYQHAEIFCAESNLDDSDDCRVVDDMILLNQQGKGFSHHKISSTEGEVFEKFKQLINLSYKSASGCGHVNFI